MSYRLKNAPDAVAEYFERQFPKADGYTHHYYWYWREFAQETKVYGCTVLKDGKHYHNATQAPVSWYESCNDQQKDCHKCGNPKQMYWCERCEENQEGAFCKECLTDNELDKHYHKNCN